jgi:hypothetical protein
MHASQRTLAILVAKRGYARVAMSKRTVFYEGEIPVAGTSYAQSIVNSAGDLEDVPIDGLDTPVTRKHRLDFTLDYPFDRPYEGHVIGDAGVTLRQVIDAIREGYRVMYRGAAVSDLANLHNKLVQGEYGQAVHVIGDLVIERIVVDEESGRIEIGIGS